MEEPPTLPEEEEASYAYFRGICITRALLTVLNTSGLEGFEFEDCKHKAVKPRKRQQVLTNYEPDILEHSDEETDTSYDSEYEHAMDDHREQKLRRASIGQRDYAYEAAHRSAREAASGVSESSVTTPSSSSDESDPPQRKTRRTERIYNWDSWTLKKKVI